MSSSNFEFGGFKQNANERHIKQSREADKQICFLTKSAPTRTFYANVDAFSQPSSRQYKRPAGKVYKTVLPDD